MDKKLNSDSLSIEFKLRMALSLQMKGKKIFT
jgi:hypothetical protein